MEDRARILEILGEWGMSEKDWIKIQEAREICKKVNRNLRRKNSALRYEVLMNSNPNRLRK